MDEGEMKNQFENEMETKSDFVQIFHERLKKIKPILSINEKDHLEFYYLKDVGVKSLEKEAPAIVFGTGDIRNPNLEIWIMSFEDLMYDNDAPHREVKDDLMDYYQTTLNKKLSRDTTVVPAYIFQDKDRKLYLFTDIDGSEMIMKYSKRYEQEFQSLMKKYGIEKTIGKLPGKTSKNIFINEDILGKIRENKFLHNFAKKYEMTNTQFLRFYTLIQSSKKANSPINYHKLAEEIIEDDKNNLT